MTPVDPYFGRAKAVACRYLAQVLLTRQLAEEVELGFVRTKRSQPGDDVSAFVELFLGPASCVGLLQSERAAWRVA